MAPIDILIVGGSVAGTTLAAFLLSSSLPATEKPRITIVERSANPYAHGQNVDIRGAGVALLRKLGIEAAVRAGTTGEEGVQWVTRDNRVWMSIAAGSDEKVHMPTSDVEIMRGRLAEICHKRSKALSDEVQQAGGAGIEFIFGESIDELTHEGDKVHVRFSRSQSQRSFDLVVGADGLGSRTRKMVWGEAGETERVHHLGIFGAFFSIPPGPTDTTWRRCYHTKGQRLVMVRPDLPSGRTSVLLSVVNETDSRFRQVGAEGRERLDDQKSLLREYFQGIGWESQRIIDEMMKTEDFYYNIVAQVKMPAWSKGRAVLIGDAAYCPSYLTGKGTTLAMLGAYHLAGALSQHTNDLSAAFAMYEAKMRPAVEDGQQLKLNIILPLLYPKSALAVWLIDTILGFLMWCRLINLLLLFKRTKKESNDLEDYGFKTLGEMKG